MPPRKGGTTKANAKGAIATTTDLTHGLNSSNSPALGVIGPTRGGTATRGAKRRRTSNNNSNHNSNNHNNNNSNSNEIYGSGTIVAANPFDDDHNHLQHFHIQQQQHHHIPLANATSKMMSMQPLNPLPMHHPSHPIYAHHPIHQAPPLSASPLQHSQLAPVHPHHHQMPLIDHHQHPQQMNQPMYSPNNFMQQPMPMIPAPSHTNHHMGTPPGPMGGGPPPQPAQLQPDHLTPSPVGHPRLHNDQEHVMIPGGGPPHQNFLPPQQQQQQQPPLQHATQTQMIGTSTPPQMMSAIHGPAPSHSPYMQHHPPPLMQVPQQHPSPIMQQPQSQQGPPPQPQVHPSMLVPPHQSMTPQSPHLEQMLMQQPYAVNHVVYCGECQREVYQNESNIICKAGCGACFHITCTGLTPLACDLLMKESLAEWACDRCTSGNRRVPFVKYKTS